MKLTITRALTEIKNLKARIYSQTRELDVFAVQRGKALIQNPSIKPEDFENNAKQELQSLKDLINRQIAIKTAIDQSNSTTKVTIGGKEMTVQEALVRKSFIDEKQGLLNKLKDARNSASRCFDEAVRENAARVEKMVQTEITSSTGTTKGAAAKTERENILEQFTNMVESTSAVKLLDPAGCDEYIKELEKEIQNFSTEIDYVLSESNSTTFIEILD